MSTIAGRVPIRRDLVVRVAALATLALGGLIVGASMATTMFPFTICLAVGGLIAVAAFFDAGTALLGALVFLLLLGIERRAFEYGLDTGGSSVDPLFLIPPLVTVALVAVAAGRGAFRDRTPLTSVVLGICVAGLVGAINPLQGSLLAGGLGVVIFMAPVLWFWIGRALVDDHRMQQILTVTILVTGASAIYGLAQTAGHFFSWDLAWIDSQTSYVSLRFQGVVRGFGFSSSAAEYGKLLAAGVAVLAASIIARQRFWLVPLLSVVMAALFLSGLRTTLVLAVVGMGLIWGTRRGASIMQLTVYGVLAIVVLLLAAARVTPGGSGDGGAAVLASRQVQGLSDPFNERSSTLQSHVQLVARSFTGMATAPIGQGTATITIAGKRFGASAAGDTDIADAAIAFGVVGVVLYVALCGRLFKRAHRLAVVRGDMLSLAALGLVVVSSLQWLNGGLYGANMLAWLTFGWIDRASAELPEESAGASERATGVQAVDA